ncbi:hypothetical protein IQ06DRAFT_110292 [Phaeosphaeriaceae sp. SRC1lsM3a]|nr:hypothetical protein IQ06DRAFT_110292 [Stagonospora sp. SRC1lsM3a]
MGTLVIASLLIWGFAFASVVQGKGWYLDTSCDSKREIVKSGIRQAFILAEAALDVVGSSPGNDANANWVFLSKSQVQIRF